MGITKLRTYSFKALKENKVLRSQHDSSPTQLEYEDATVNLTDDNGGWFSRQDDTVKADLYEEWRHNQKDVIDFDKWLTTQRKSQRSTPQA